MDAAAPAAAVPAAAAQAPADPAHHQQQQEKEEEEEGRICSICLEPLPRWGDKFMWLACCGKGIHVECNAQLDESASWGRCPLCRTTTAGSPEETHKQALRWARKGKLWAMTSVGCDFENGRGVSESKEMAFLWYKKAAEQGYARAQFSLGQMHRKGEGVPVSYELARVWTEKAAEQGLPVAQSNLGAFHHSGMGLPVSKEKARVWFKRAAEQGHASAQFNLGAYYVNGEGGPNSQEHGFFWLSLAAKQGNEQATTIAKGMKSRCYSCGKTGKMQRCPQCKCAYYCSRKCQKAAWTGGHKAACKQIRRKELGAN